VKQEHYSDHGDFDEGEDDMYEPPEDVLNVDGPRETSGLPPLSTHSKADENGSGSNQFSAREVCVCCDNDPNRGTHAVSTLTNSMSPVQG
jgi:hypothetical protein